MKITTLSCFAVAAVAFALSTATAAQAVTGCAASKAAAGLTNLNAPVEGDPTAGQMGIPDAQALAKAVGGFGAVATLIAGGTLLYRRRQDGSRQDGKGLAAEVLAAGSLPEIDFSFEVQAESVLVAEETLVEASVLEASLETQASAPQAEEPALSLSR